MIEMDQKEQILHYHRVDGLSLREISRRVGLNRKTVTRYIRDYEASIRENPEEGLDICLASKPKYPARNVECTRMTEPVCAEIEYWLQENAKRRQTGMRKQCLKKQDIHRVLIEKGFNISYSSVCKYIQRRKTEKSKKPKDVFVKQYYEPGQECEFDWGEVKLRIGSKPVTFTMAVFALCHSEGRWAYLFRHQDNLAFMESHRNFFHDVHGVPHTMVYDNMKVAVTFLC
jgi:transposase